MALIRHVRIHGDRVLAIALAVLAQLEIWTMEVWHGPSAVDHCVTVVNDLRQLLAELTGTA